MSRSARRDDRRFASDGAIVADEMNTEPGGITGNTPSSPKSTASVCALFTTTQSTTLALVAASAGDYAIRAPVAANFSVAVADGS